MESLIAHASQQRQGVKRWMPYCLLLVLCAIFAFGFFTTIPRFDVTDEGFYLRQAAERINGLPHPLNLAYVTSLSPLYPETPFYSMLLAGYLKIAGLSVASGRFLASSILVGIIAITSMIAYHLQGRRASLLTIVGFLGTPYFWYFGRHITPHPLTILLLEISLLGVVRCRQRQSTANLMLSIIPAVIAIFVSYWAIGYCFVLPLLLFKRSRWFWLIGVIPGVSLLVYWYSRYVSLGSLFIDDVHRFYHWMRSAAFSVRPSFLRQLENAILQFFLFIFSSPPTFLGSIGLFFVKNIWSKRSLVLLYVTGGLYFFRDRLLVITPYITIFLLPFAAIGFGVAVDKAWLWIEKQFQRYSALTARVIIFCGIIALCSVQVIFFIPYITTEITSHTAAITLQKIKNVSDFVNEKTSAKSFVIASQEVFWLMHSRSVEYVTLYAYGSAAHGTWDNVYSKDVSYYSTIPTIENAAYVIDRREFTSTYGPDFQSLYAPIYLWEKVYDDGTYAVYKHP